MAMHRILSFWEAAEKRGESPKAVYAVLGPEGLIDWSVSRRNASKVAGETDGSRLARISPI